MARSYLSLGDPEERTMRRDTEERSRASGRSRNETRCGAGRFMGGDGRYRGGEGGVRQGDACQKEGDRVCVAGQLRGSRSRGPTGGLT